MEYPYNTPIIMTDAIFSSYGGDVSGTMSGQRQVAYWIAERFVSEDLETFLLPTIVTGSYAYASPLKLEHMFVTQIWAIRFYDYDNSLYWQTSGTVSEYADLRPGDYGRVNLRAGVLGLCSCHAVMPYPQRLEVVYTAGLVSGSSYQPNFLLALTEASKLILNEMVGFGNESAGDVGVQRWSNQDYSETRVGLLRTVYGTSAKAQFIHKLLSPNRKYREVGL